MKKILSSLLFASALAASLVPSCVPDTASNVAERTGDVAQALTAADACYFGGPVVPNLTLNGSARMDGTSIELTSAEAFKDGSVFFNAPLTTEADLHAAFELRFSDHHDGGGQGIAFVLQSSAAGPKAIVSSADSDAGKKLAYDGLSPAVAVEFDTAVSGAFDPDANHVALTRGKIDHDDPVNKNLPVSTAPFDMKASSSVFAWIDYVKSSHTLAVFVADTATKPSLPLLSTANVNLATELGAQVYAGFTAATEHVDFASTSPSSRQRVSAFAITDHAAFANAACCLVSADCKSADAPVCDPVGHVCGKCSLEDVSKCAAGEGCSVASGAGKCVPSCNKDSDCESPDFPLCSGSGATEGSCVVCDANFGAMGDFPCGASAKLCKDSGFCASALGNGTVCTTAADCESGFCADGLCCDAACGGGDPNDCQACSKAEGSAKDGECMVLADAAACEDGDLCTVEDACFQGACMVGNVTDCSSNGFCQSDKGCTCKAGYAGLVCQYSDASTCSGHGVAQEDGTCKCDENYGGAFCSKCAENHFGDDCASVCNPAACPTAANGCQAAACSPEGTCVYTTVAEGGSCTDGNACTEDDKCVANKCVGSKPKNCAATDTCHQDGVCDYKTGQCLNPVLPDLSVCTSMDGAQGTCGAGECIVPDPLDGRGKGGKFGAQGGFACAMSAPGVQGGRQGGHAAMALALGLSVVARRRRSKVRAA